MYQDGVLINEARVWDPFEDKNTESRNLQLGLRIDNSDQTLSWECVVKGKDSGVFSKYNESPIPDTIAGAYSPLDEAVYIKPDEETILLSYVFDDELIRAIDNQAFSKNPDYFKNFECVVLFKCSFSES